VSDASEKPNEIEVHESDSVAQTEAVAARLAESLRGGECLALHGDLGAGKTQFVRGLVRGLGGNPRAVSSPTFVLLNVYDSDAARLTVYHLDAYRVGGADDFEAIGFPELLEQPDAVVVVEWAERVSELLPPDRIDVRLEPVAEGRRRITVKRQARP
jgi:tRNA threonylcarbamoyladenosine biosynthesis protein TsaE